MTYTDHCKEKELRPAGNAGRSGPGIFAAWQTVRGMFPAPFGGAGNSQSFSVGCGFDKQSGACLLPRRGGIRTICFRWMRICQKDRGMFSPLEGGENRTIRFRWMRIWEVENMGMEEQESGAAMERALVTRVTKQELARWTEENELQYQELMSYCRCALHSVEALVQTAGEELALQSGNHPIEEVTGAVKSPERIADRMMAEGAPLTALSIEQHIRDLVQVRVVCPFLNDLYRVADRLEWQEGVTVLSKEDTASEARADGYRGLHLLLTVPVTLKGRSRAVKVEVILRTPAMDLWVRSERKLRQRQREMFLPEQISQELHACAGLGAEWDQRMEQMRYNVEHRVITK